MSMYEGLHPGVIISYYVSMLILVIWSGHPAFFLILFVMMGGCICLTSGIRQFAKDMLYSVLIALACMIINPLFNHRGVSLLFQIGSIRITKEATIYGGYMALLFLTSLLLFSAFSHVMTSEKIMTLTGRRFPSFSLLFSMILRMVPRVSHDYREMMAVHRGRVKVWSALISKLMEDAVERSIAMRQKRYNSGKRTSYMARKFGTLDFFVLIYIAIFTVYFVFYRIYTPVTVQFFPSVRIDIPDIDTLLRWMLYTGLPIWMHGLETILWISSKRKITNTTTQERMGQPYISKDGQ